MSSRPLGAGRAAASRLDRRLFARAPGGVGATLSLYAHLWRHGDLPRVVSEAPAAARAVVLAPHPDDETIGCGGLVRKLTLAGAVVSVVFLSEGRRGAAAARSWRSDRGAEERLVERRKGEAAAAAEVLGVEGLIFLDLRDGEVYADAAAVGRLRDELARLRPDIVLLPFLTDQHPDHLATSGLFLAAAAQLYGAGPAPACWAYETQTPLFANVVVDINAVAETKWEALSRYESQNSQLDYISTTRGLNAFRWVHVAEGGGYAEAFYACSLADYGRLYALIAEPDPQ